MEEVANGGSNAPAAGTKRTLDQQWEDDRGKRAKVPENEAVPEAMPEGTYFNALLDYMPTLLGASTKPLDHDGMKGLALYDLIARHSFVVSFVPISWFLDFTFPSRADSFSFTALPCRREA